MYAACIGVGGSGNAAGVWLGQRHVVVGLGSGQSVARHG